MSHGKEIKKSILQAGLALWPKVTARGIGRQLGMTHSNVLYHFDNADNLANAVASYAVETGESRVIVQLITAKHTAIDGMKAADRAKHMATI